MFTRKPCPHCYYRIDPKRLSYQCTGHGAPTKDRAPCRKRVDSARKKAGRPDKEERLPSFEPRWYQRPAPRRTSCPDCGSVTGIRVCPVCHSPLPPGFSSSRSPLIAMLGAKNTGKTVYLTVLANELRTSLRRRFRADVRLSGGSEGGADSPQAWLAANIKQVFQDRRLQDQTGSALGTGRRDALVFEWRQAVRRLVGTRFRTTYLSFYDTAGEDLSTQDNARGLRYLAAADALILLLDPFTLPQTRDRLHLPEDAVGKVPIPAMDVLGNVTDTLRESRSISSGKRIDLPVAVAFSKIDAFFELLGPDSTLLKDPDEAIGHYDDTLGRATHEDVRALLDDFGADEIDAHLSANYANYRYFVVSALGAPPDYTKQIVEAGGVRPYRVGEPLLWLLSRFNVVPARRRA